MMSLAEPYILDLAEYIPGRSVQEVKREFGFENFIKLASNENALGPSPKALIAAQGALRNAHVYPTELRLELKHKIVHYLGIDEIGPNQIVLGNGSNELIMLIARAFLGPNQALLNTWPSFIVYRIAAHSLGRQEFTYPLESTLEVDVEKLLDLAKRHRDQIKLLYLPNPNNPTGAYLNAAKINYLLANIDPQVIVVIDEAYAEYVTAPDWSTALPHVAKRPRTVVLRTFSKIFGLAGLRMGYGVMPSEMAQILHRIRDPFNVNGIAQAACIAALDDAEHTQKSRDNNAKELPRVAQALRSMGLSVPLSMGNFVLMTTNNDAEPLAYSLLERGIIVRPVKNYDLPNSLRVTIGKPEENDLFLQAMSDLML